MTEPMTTDYLNAKVELRRAWFAAYPDKPVPEARAEVDALMAYVEGGERAALAPTPEPSAEADAAHDRCVRNVGHALDCPRGEARPATPPLDVKRLATALRNLPDVRSDFLRTGAVWDEVAVDLAREYAALAATTPEPDRGPGAGYPYIGKPAVREYAALANPDPETA